MKGVTFFNTVSDGQEILGYVWIKNGELHHGGSAKYGAAMANIAADLVKNGIVGAGPKKYTVSDGDKFLAALRERFTGAYLRATELGEITEGEEA